MYLPYFVFVRLHRYAIDARRRDRTWRYVAWSALAGLTAGLIISCAAFIGYLLVLTGRPILAVVMIALVSSPIVAHLLVRHVAVPLGMPRLAYRLGLIGYMGRDGEAFASCVAAWAYASKPTAEGEAWIIARRDRRKPLGDAEVVATAFLAAGRGDADTARQLLRSARMLVENHPAVRELAGEWLACDAAERGAWIELAADAAAAVYPATPLTFFLEGVAARRVGAAGAPGPLELWLRWVASPRPTRTRWLLDPRLADRTATPTAASRGLSRSGGPSPTVAAIDPITTAPLPRAIATHLAIGSALTSADLGTAVKAWDTALADPATRDWLARRALELGAPLGAADKALAEIAAAVADDLAKRAEAGSLAAPPLQGSVADALGRRLRHGRLDALEAGFTRWAERRPDGAARAPTGMEAASGGWRAAIDEWREFIALRAAYDSAVAAGGVELRRLAFPHAYRTGNSMATWLWNTRHEYPISHAISKWLLEEALAVGDTEAIELGHRNCNLDVPTRV